MLESIIVGPMKGYLDALHNSENVNGCIYNWEIGQAEFINLTRFDMKMRDIYRRQTEQRLKMYVTYFELWEIYFMERAYIDDFLMLFKKIRAFRLVEE